MLGEMVRFGRPSFLIEGELLREEEGIRLSVTCTPPVRSLKLDGVLQSSSTEYLKQGTIVWFGSDDLLLVNGPAERRRKLLDYLKSKDFDRYAALIAKLGLRK